MLLRKTWRLFVPSARSPQVWRPQLPPPVALARWQGLLEVRSVAKTSIEREVYVFFLHFHGFVTETCNASARHRLESVTRVTLEKRQNGGEVRMVLGRCAMPVAYVRISCHAT